MSSELVPEPAIELRQLAKRYRIYARPVDRLLQALWRGRRIYFREFEALAPTDLVVPRGQTLGLIGRNGAGKSTLLKLVCNTLTPSSGTLTINGRVAALLELGAGFNPEFTGRENVLFTGALMGLSREEITTRMDAIIDFAGIREFIDQPVKTYSSGMFVRLAFSLATSVDPDILVIDEALAVGDGDFSRKSLDRIMALKEAGKTILFCSPALYQVQVLCDRALWLDHGKIAAIGKPADVVVAYETALNAAPVENIDPAPSAPLSGSARITGVRVCVDGEEGLDLKAHSGQSVVTVDGTFASDPQLPVPSVAVVLFRADAILIATICTQHDGVMVARRDDGGGTVRATFPTLPLVKGHYWVDALVLCERALHLYDAARRVAKLEITQTGLDQGVVSLAHTWDPMGVASPCDSFSPDVTSATSPSSAPCTQPSRMLWPVAWRAG